MTKSQKEYMGYDLAVNFGYKGELGDEFRVFPELFYKLSFAGLPESEFVHFSYAGVVGGSFGTDCKGHFFVLFAYN